MDSHKTGFRPIRVKVNLHFITFSLFEKEVPLVTTEKGILALDFYFIPLLQFTTVFFRGCYHARIKPVPFCALFCGASPSMSCSLFPPVRLPPQKAWSGPGVGVTGRSGIIPFVGAGVL